MTDAQKKIAQEAKEFVDELMPTAIECVWKKEYPWLLANEVAKRGWYGTMIPNKYGGHLEDWGITGACILAEETDRLQSFTGYFNNTMSHGGTNQLVHHGNNEQKQRWLPRIAKDQLFGAVVMTEPYVGSDSATMETTGVLKGSDYVVNGKKRFITNAGAANLYNDLCQDH